MCVLLKMGPFLVDGNMYFLALLAVSKRNLRDDSIISEALSMTCPSGKAPCWWVIQEPGSRGHLGNGPDLLAGSLFRAGTAE